MRDLPSGWKKVKLSDAYWFQEGPGVRRWQFKMSGIKLLNVGNITKDNTLDLEKTDRHLDPEEVATKYKHFLVDAGDLVIASSGISFDADGFLRTRGAFVKKDDLPLCMNTSTIRFKSVDQISDLKYFRYWLQSNEFRAQVSKFVTGSAQLNFGPSHLKKMSISLPPLTEQKRIAAILDKADALRTKRRAALAKLDTLLQSTFLEFMDSMKDLYSEIQLKNLAMEGKGTFVNGPFGSNLLTSELTASGVPVIYIRDIRNGEYQRISSAFVTDKKAEQLSVCKVQPSDALIAKVGDPPGISAVYPEDEPTGIVTQDVIRLRLNPEICDEVFFSYYLNSPLGKHKIKSITVEATRARFSLTDLKKLEIAIPPAEKQKEFSKIAKSIENNRQSHRQGLHELDNLFHALQQRAFKGEL